MCNNYVILRWNSRVHKHSHWNISFLQSHFLVFFFRIEKNFKLKDQTLVLCNFFFCDNIFHIFFQNSLGIRFQGGFNSKIAVQKHSKFSTGMIFCSKNQSTLNLFFFMIKFFFTNFFLIFSFRGRLYSLKLCEMNFFKGGNRIIIFWKKKCWFFF